MTAGGDQQKTSSGRERTQAENNSGTTYLGTQMGPEWRDEELAMTTGSHERRARASKQHSGKPCIRSCPCRHQRHAGREHAREVLTTARGLRPQAVISATRARHRRATAAPSSSRRPTAAPAERAVRAPDVGRLLNRGAGANRPGSTP